MQALRPELQAERLPNLTERNLLQLTHGLELALRVICIFGQTAQCFEELVRLADE
jgi:hypothetical protein